MHPKGANTNKTMIKIANLIHNQFGLKPKEQTYMYQHLYPEWHGRVALPSHYRVLDFLVRKM